MIKKKILLFTGLLILIVPIIEAQKEAIKWGKISDEEINLKEYLPDTTANAVVLADYGEIRINIQVDGIRYEFRRHKRIKILKRSSENPKSIQVPFYDDDKAEKIVSFKVQLFSADGRKKSLGKKNVWDEIVGKEQRMRCCSLPNLEPGSIIEYRYEIVSDRITKIRDWYFQEDIPVAYSELKVEIPEWLEYIALTQGEIQHLQDDQKASFALEIDNEAILERDPRVRVVTSRYILKDVPAMKEEAYLSSVEDYRPKIQLRLSKIFYPNGKSQSYIGSWPELAQKLEKSDRFGLQYLKPENFAKLSVEARKVTERSSGKMEQIKAIYNFLNSRLKWDGRYSIYATRSLDESFEAGSASSGEMNLMLLALLRERGFQANPLLISTRSHGKMVQQYPFVDQFDHVLVQLGRENDSPLLLDLSDPYRPVNYPRVEALNSYGWLLSDKGGEWITVAPPSGNDLMVATADLSSEGILSGYIQCKSSGYSAVEERKSYSEKRDGSFWKNRFKPKGQQVMLDSFSASNFAEISEPFQTEVYFSQLQVAEVRGDKLLFDPTLVTNYAESLLKTEERLWPVDIPFPFKEQFVIRIKLPEGYEVESMPESVRVLIRNDGGTYHYVLNENDGYLELINKIQVKQIKYQPEDYGNIKDFFDIIADKVNEKVVLRKAGSH